MNFILLKIIILIIFLLIGLGVGGLVGNKVGNHKGVKECDSGICPPPNEYKEDGKLWKI